jgi:hydrogenase maturation protease
MRPRSESAAPDDGSGALSRRVLILGFGNTLRRDDGAGAVAARLLAADPRLAGEDVEVREAYQLLPEMALDLGEVGLVVLVDADMRGLPGSIEMRELDPAEAVRADADARSEPGASSHHVGGGELLALAAELTGHAPRAVAVGIGVADLEVGEGLSPVVESALPRVVEAVVGIVAQYRTGE